jgi:uncharacterized membrane protein (DUF2068 family)
MPIHPPAVLTAVDERASKAGLRTIAILEAVKGLFVLLVALALLHNLHRDLGEAAANLVRDLHINPEWHYGRIFVDAADKLDDGKVWAMASVALGYSTVRIVEAYGLWNRRVWAEWFALVSGALYIPFEIYEVILRRTWLPWALLWVNVLIVAYMAYIRITAWQRKQESLDFSSN